MRSPRKSTLPVLVAAMSYVPGKRKRALPASIPRRTRPRPDPSAELLDPLHDPLASAAGPSRRASQNLRTGGYLGIELKFLDVYGSQISIPAPTDCSGGEMQPEGGCTDCLSVPAQGDGEQQRDGRRILMKSIFVSGAVKWSTSSDQDDAFEAGPVFVALVLDTQTNGSTIVSEQVYTNPNDTANVNTYPLRNLQYSSRFRVLDHVTIQPRCSVAFNDAAATGTMAWPIEHFTLSNKKVSDIPMTFSSTTADVANAIDNSLHLIAFCTATSPAAALSYNSRMRFVG